MDLKAQDTMNARNEGVYCGRLPPPLLITNFELSSASLARAQQTGSRH